MIYTPLKKRKKIRSFPFHKKCHERKESPSFFTLFLFFDFSFHRNPVGKRGRNFVRMEIAEVVAILVPFRREKNRKIRPKDEGVERPPDRVNFTFAREFYFDPAVFPTTALRRDPCLHKEVPRCTLSIPPIFPWISPLFRSHRASRLITSPLDRSCNWFFVFHSTPVSSKS